MKNQNLKIKERTIFLGLTSSLFCLSFLQGNCQSLINNNQIYSDNESEVVIDYLRLGLNLKRGNNIPQDFQKAYETFEKGAHIGDQHCIHELGNLLFKGLGCEQDYVKAFYYYNLAAEQGNVLSKYMTAICYRNGYGVAQNEEKARMILSELAEAGFYSAKVELSNKEPELKRWELSKYNGVSIKDIHWNESICDNINGLYTGDIVMYDNSKTHVIYEMPAVFVAQENNNIIEGYITTDNECFPLNGKIIDNKIEFDDCSIDVASRYSKQPFSYKIENANIAFHADSAYICFNTNIEMINEPGRPIYFFAKKDNVNGIKSITNKTFNISCQTIAEDCLKIQYTLPSEGKNVSVILYNIAGNILFVKNISNAHAGINSIITNKITEGKEIIVQIITRNNKTAQKCIIK